MRGSRSCRKSICDGYIPDQPERAGWIEDGPDWLAARRLCNRLVHECLRGPEEMAAVLRDAFRYIDVQRQTLQRMTQEAAPGCSHHAANPHIAQRRTPIWRIATNDKDRHRFLPFIATAQFVLFEFRTPLASHFARSPSNHSYGYASSGDRTNC